MNVGYSDKFEISGLIFQINFPPLSWIGKAYNLRYFSHCSLCSAILGKVSLRMFSEENPRHP
jgi:hypothetical protein